MRGFLALLFLVGLVMMGASALAWIGLQPELYKQPAIVIVPQLILASIGFRFGALLAAISGTGAVLISLVSDLRDAMPKAPVEPVVERQRQEPPLASGQPTRNTSEQARMTLSDRLLPTLFRTFGLRMPNGFSSE
jgi:hypothetical protein